jgi:hypothetical protein
MTGNGGTPLGEVEYADLVSRVRASIAGAIPPSASALVISKGDPALLDMSGIAASHFPQDGAGGYAGHHPHDSDTAIAEIEELRRRGAEYLVIPATARWWLDHYDGFARHLATHGDLIADDPDSCLIFRLGKGGLDPGMLSSTDRPGGSIEQMRDFLENLIATDAELAVLEANGGIAPALAPLRAVSLHAGVASGHDGESLLAQLRLLAAGGAEYLVVPRAEDDLAGGQAEIEAAIEASCRKVADQQYLCRVFDLRGLHEVGG